MPDRAREVAAEIMRFVRGAQGMTHDERAWFVERIEPIVRAALVQHAAEVLEAAAKEFADCAAVTIGARQDVYRIVTEWLRGRASRIRVGADARLEGDDAADKAKARP